MITVHADVVGSLLRPPQLIEARTRLAAGGIDASRFKEIEDRAVLFCARPQSHDLPLTPVVNLP